MDKPDPIGLRHTHHSAVETLGVTLVLFPLLSAYKPNAPDWKQAVRSASIIHASLLDTQEKPNAVEKQDVAEERIA